MDRIVSGAAAIAVLSGLMIAQQDGGQTRPAAQYTAAQASAGRAAYQTSCAACHAPDLSGREGPQLTGLNFRRQWGDKTVGELINFMRVTMPTVRDLAIEPSRRNRTSPSVMWHQRAYAVGEY